MNDLLYHHENSSYDELKSMSTDKLIQMFNELLHNQYDRLIFMVYDILVDRTSENYVKNLAVDYDKLISDRRFVMNGVDKLLHHIKYVDIITLTLTLAKYNMTDKIRDLLEYIIGQDDSIEILKHFKDNDVIKNAIDDEFLSDIDFMLTDDVRDYIMNMIKPVIIEDGICPRYDIINNDGMFIEDKYLFAVISKPHLIPVHRHEEQNRYVIERDRRYRNGKAYFYDPRSKQCLISNKTLFAPNKFIAYVLLLRYIDDKIIKYMSKIPTEHKDTISDMIKNSSEGVIKLSRLYNISIPDIYGLDDIFDTELMIEARLQGFDSICLIYQQMRTRVDSVVIDVRNKGLSTNNLCMLW